MGKLTEQPAPKIPKVDRKRYPSGLKKPESQRITELETRVEILEKLINAVPTDTVPNTLPCADPKF